MSELYLIHHGILGQKWGKKQGPPYPLGASDHSSAERKAGKSGWSKEAKKEENTNNISEKHKFNYKTAVKVGAIAVGTGLAVYGGYKLYKSGALEKISKDGKDVVTDLINESIKNDHSSFIEQNKSKTSNIVKDSLLKNGYKVAAKDSAINDFFDINNLDKYNSIGSDKNCVACSTSNAIRLLGIKTQAKINVTEGSNFIVNIGKGRSINELTKAFKGTTIQTPQNVNNISDVRKELLKHGEGAVGIFRYVTPKGNGHAVTWSVENGKVKISDPQHANKLLQEAISLKVDPEVAKQKIYDTLSDIPDSHYKDAVFSNSFRYIRIDNATEVIPSILDSLVTK